MIFGSWCVDKKVLANVVGATSSDVKINTAIVDTTTLSKKVQDVVSDKPVFDFSIVSGGKTISDFGNGKVTITIPYTLAKGEKANNILVYYIKNDGNLETVKNCYYDEKTKTVSFVTNHFSKYAVGNKTVSYKDIPSWAWYLNSVEFVSARELFSGVGNDNFNPDGKMTKAMFVTVMANLDGADTSAYTSSPFADVEINSWYGKPVAWAESNKIISGDALFNPNENINYEEIALILDNYIKHKGIDLKVVSETPFADINKVSGEAKKAVEHMKKYGLINGTGDNKFAPERTASRAEAATIFTNIIKTFSK